MIAVDAPEGQGASVPRSAHPRRMGHGQRHEQGSHAGWMAREGERGISRGRAWLSLANASAHDLKGHERRKAAFDVHDLALELPELGEELSDGLGVRDAPVEADEGA